MCQSFDNILIVKVCRELVTALLTQTLFHLLPNSTHKPYLFQDTSFSKCNFLTQRPYSGTIWCSIWPPKLGLVGSAKLRVLSLDNHNKHLAWNSERHVLLLSFFYDLRSGVCQSLWVNVKSFWQLGTLPNLVSHDWCGGWYVIPTCLWHNSLCICVPRQAEWK